MKIDIHSHTKKTKTGDSENRNIDVTQFSEIIKSTDVKIFAITNHNHFDFDQYKEFNSALSGICQIWPGIELDILQDGIRAHLIVIVNPKNADSFNDKVNLLLQGKTADLFTISLEDTVSNFDSLDPIYVSHYHSKKPNLLDKDIEHLGNIVSNNRRIIKEASNSTSAGVYISHGHNSIYGSDIQNWSEYVNVAKGLPELRLPVESFEQFCLLLEKDNATINTILNKKTKEVVTITPFGVAELIELDIYNDINIIFGSKGTGKTEILRAISKYYNDRGHKTEVYESSSVKLDEEYDLKGKRLNLDISQFGIDECIDEISQIREAIEKNTTSLSAYFRYYEAEETNKIAKNILIRNFNILNASSENRSVEELKSNLIKIKEFRKYIETDKSLQKVVDNELIQELKSTIDKILSKLRTDAIKSLIDYKSIVLFNNLVSTFAAEISKKTGMPAKPLSTGFYEYISNRIRIERNLKKILHNISIKIPAIDVNVGDLGEKGKLYCQTCLTVQSGNHIDVDFNPVRKTSKKPQRTFANQLSLIFKNIYSKNLFEKIAELNEIENGDSISCISDLVLFKRHFLLNNQPYTPSNGESSMILLHTELMKDKEIYILDEPEKSLGNDYISDVIVPLLKNHAIQGHKVIIATHDANIAVRTLPYNSIYRMHDINKYFTFTGNPFANKLVCKTGTKGDLDWKVVSMKTLEGGKEAFGERGKIYGNT